MKKVLTLILSVVLMLSCFAPVHASAASTPSTYSVGLNYLQSHGINERTIALMSEDEICEYANAQFSQSDSSYYAYIYDKETENITLEQYTVSEYNSIVQKMKTRASNDKEYSWMLLTITSTYLGGDNYCIMCEYEWLTNPVVRYTDIVALTFDTRIVSQKGTGSAKMEYTNSDGLPTEVDYSSLVKYSNTGVYVDFNIPGWGNTDIFGYMSTNAKVNNLSGNTVSFNNWAYYAHKTNVFSGSYSVSFPVGGGFTITPSGSFNVADVGLLTTYNP